jgi:hypothetical protein
MKLLVCSLVQHPATSSHLVPNILFSTLSPCSQTSSICDLPLVCETMFHTRTKYLVKLAFCIFDSVSFQRGKG